MNMLVLGGSVFLGSHVCDKLSEAGHHVRILDCVTSPWLRQDIIDELVRISSKTILILVGNELLQLEKPSFKIEQLKRAIFAESIARYFDKHLNHGEVYAVFSPESIGLLFLCDNKNTNIS